MDELNYESICNEVAEKLAAERSIVLSTAARTKVTARTMSHVNDGLAIMVQTGGKSEKLLQIKENPNVAFAASNIQIEAVAIVCGHPLDEKNKRFAELFKNKFAQYFEKYTSLPDEVVLRCEPVKITLYKYIDGNPCKDILDVPAQRAFRTGI